MTLFRADCFKNREITLPDRDVVHVGTRFGEYIINKTGARILTSPDSGPSDWADLIGKPLKSKDREVWDSIVGICKDFRTRKLHNDIEPLAMNLNPGSLKFVLLRVAPGMTREALTHTEKVWDEFLPSRQFMFTFLEDRLDQNANSAGGPRRPCPITRNE